MCVNESPSSMSKAMIANNAELSPNFRTRGLILRPEQGKFTSHSGQPNGTVECSYPLEAVIDPTIVGHLAILIITDLDCS